MHFLTADLVSFIESKLPTKAKATSDEPINLTDDDLVFGVSYPIFTYGYSAFAYDEHFEIYFVKRLNRGGFVDNFFALFNVVLTQRFKHST